jgi:hypothetical protein
MFYQTVKNNDSINTNDEKNSIKSGSQRTDLSKSKKHKIALITLFDYVRMEKLVNIINKIYQAKSITETLIPILESSTEVVNCSHISVFVFSKKVLSEKDKRLLTI